MDTQQSTKRRRRRPGPFELRRIRGVMGRKRAEKNARRALSGAGALPPMRHPKARERARKARQA